MSCVFVLSHHICNLHGSELFPMRVYWQFRALGGYVCSEELGRNEHEHECFSFSGTALVSLFLRFFEC